LHNLAKRFEIVILRPLHIVLLISSILFLFKGAWLWLAGCALALLYLGTVGSKLHPFQSASDLAKGPLMGSAARIESELLPSDVVKMLVSQACIRVGILVGVTTGLILWRAFGYRWYLAFPVAWVIVVLTSALLRLAFKTEPNQA
jgi:hypothetical protein